VVAEILEKERDLDSLDTWKRFAKKVDRHRDELRALLIQLKEEGKKVFGLGASTKGNVLLQYCGIDAQLLTAIADVNPEKHGTFTPGTGIPICSEDEARAANPDVFLVLPWHFRMSFIKREAAFVAAGGRLLFPLPKIELWPQ
jgi:hypothetical protein